MKFFRIKKLNSAEQSDSNCGQEVEDESEEEVEYETSDEEADNDESESDQELVDLEDLGSFMQKAKSDKSKVAKSFKNGVVKEMVTPVVRKSLTKQGDQICSKSLVNLDIQWGSE